MAQAAGCGVGGHGKHGGYWIPLHEILERHGFEMVRVNTRELARVPGRSKTDRRDCEWIQRLHSCGLLRGAFRPSEQICMLRTLVRDKGNLIAERGDWVRRMQKSLDPMNVRVHRAVSDLDGATGMAIIRAIVKGERDPKQLATLRDPRCRKSEEEMAEQLSGHWREDHLFSLEQARSPEARMAVAGQPPVMRNRQDSDAVRHFETRHGMESGLPAREAPEGQAKRLGRCFVRFDSTWESLRGEPRYQALLRNMGLAQ